MMSWDPIWEEIFSDREWGKYPSEELIRFIARNFYNKKRSDIKILEVGCGTGANLWYIAREGFQVYGIDGSETAVKITKDRLNLEIVNWKGEIIQGDILNIAFPNNYFDAVIDVEAIYANSFENAKQIFNEIYRVLKKDGLVFSKHFAEGCWGDQTGEKVGDSSWNPSEGPMADKGYTRFASKLDMELLLSNFNNLELEQIIKTYNNQQNKVIEWIAVAKK